jgi:ArsR family transcriptional regulator
MKKQQISFQRLQGHYIARAEIIKALAHPTRLFIVDRLSEREHCVCELTEMIGADTSTVSKHLSVMKNAGIVSCYKRGLQVWYSLKCPCILNFFGCVEETIRQGAREHMELARSCKC